jgi:predicted RNA-binding protein YlxR (DUF448 family)
MIVVDASGTRRGRGAYLCGEDVCIERALRRERLAHAFRVACGVTPDLATSVAVFARRRGAAARVSVE